LSNTIKNLHDLSFTVIPDSKHTLGQQWFKVVMLVGVGGLMLVQHWHDIVKLTVNLHTLGRRICRVRK